MAKDFRAGTARIHRGLNRLEKVLLETRRNGALVPRGVSIVLVGGGRPELHEQNPLSGERTNAGSRGHASLIHMHNPKPGMGGRQRAVLSAAVSGMRTPQRSAKGRLLRAALPRAQKKYAAAGRQADLFPAATFTGDNTAPPGLRHGGKVPATSGRLATVKKKLWNERILLWRNEALQGKGRR